MTKLGWLYTAMLVLLMGGMAFALQDPAAGEAAADAAGAAGDTESSGKWWHGVLNGLLGGVMAAFLGWIKNRDKKTGDMEKFEIKYAVPTIIVGALVGVIAGLTGKAPADFIDGVQSSPLFGGITFVVDAGLKAVWRHSVPLLKDLLSDVKSGYGEKPPETPAPK